MAYIDLIILAAVAAFLGYRLWSILGTHDPDKPIKRKNSGFLDAEEEPIRPLHRSATVEEVIEETSHFDQTQFLQGAEVAFRIIVESFAAGNKKELKPLLSKDIYDTFSQSIDARKKAKETLEVDLSRIVQAEVLEDVEAKERQEVTVLFLSEQCSVSRDAKGNIISGDPDKYNEIKDVWTFSRERGSSNPNWILISTQAGGENDS